MKTIKYLIAGVLMMALSAPVMAQEVDYKTALEPVQKALETNAPDAADLAKKYAKTYRKNPEALVALGKAYFGAKKYAEAKGIGEQLTNNKKTANYGDAWILLGDVAVAEAEDGDAGPAAAMYETAISVDPKNKTAYERYATVNRTAAPEEAVRMLQKYKEIDPTYQVEAKIANLYFNQSTINTMKKAIDWFAKGDPTHYDVSDFFNWSTANNLVNNNEEALRVAKQGLEKFPKDPYLTRLALYRSVDLEKYDDAVNYGKQLFSDVKEKDLAAKDYYYYGSALLGAKDYQNAITNLDKAIEKEPKDLLPLGKISQAYLGLGDEDKALEYSQKYIEQATQLGYEDYNNLASIYLKKGDEATDDNAKKDYYNKAMGVWELMATKAPSVADYAYYNEAQIAQNNLKDDAKVREIHQKIITTDEAIQNLSSTNKQLLAYAYISEAIAYNNNNELDKAKELAQKTLAIDPENATAKQILNVGQPVDEAAPTE